MIELVADQEGGPGARAVMALADVKPVEGPRPQRQEQAELAATVHYTAKQLWLANDQQPVDEMTVLDTVREWKARRNPGRERQPWEMV